MTPRGKGLRRARPTAAALPPGRAGRPVAPHARAHAFWRDAGRRPSRRPRSHPAQNAGRQGERLPATPSPRSSAGGRRSEQRLVDSQAPADCRRRAVLCRAVPPAPPPPPPPPPHVLSSIRASRQPPPSGASHPRPSGRCPAAARRRVSLPSPALAGPPLGGSGDSRDSATKYEHLCSRS